MKILVIGSGGREHALAWRLSQSPKVSGLYAAPGNAGIATLAECVPIPPEDIPALAAFAKKQRIDLTVVGPEMPLVSGIADFFTERKLTIFGPSRAAARIEGSKIFAKQLMSQKQVPTASFQIFESQESAFASLLKRKGPCVVKADGLCQGKGVLVARDTDEASAAVRILMEKKAFGIAGARIIIEDCLQGEEASILALSDGKTILLLPSSQDHKRIYDRDEGPNTGGMGAYSPAPIVTPALEVMILEKIFKPILQGLAEMNAPYRGLLYAGLMISEEGPSVLEFNARFGDPESQAVLPRLKGDFAALLLEVAQGKFPKTSLEIDPRPCVSVVLASKGYPGPYEKGKVIEGLEDASKEKDIFIFHAGTSRENGDVVTNGGRVLAVSALGNTLEKAVQKAYRAVSLIHFDGMQYRRDIAHRALSRKGVPSYTPGDQT
ncbi:MAG: phosphoribosylamine--glycine ligase [Candidatus Omnitrophota bacterium]